MREIKFRVFDNDAKKMHICGDNYHDSINFLDSNNAFYYNMQNGCGSLIDPDIGKGTYELMQFTGLHDKNGKEIYEGDIFGGDKYVDGVGGQVVFDQELGAWLLVYYGGGNEFLWQAVDDSKVIGNIYENPELLETNSNK